MHEPYYHVLTMLLPGTKLVLCHRQCVLSSSLVVPRLRVPRGREVLCHRSRAACGVTLSHGEDEHGRGRISLRASDQCAHDGGGFWRLGRCWGCGDERAALPGPPARGHAACHDRPGGVRRLYHDPAHRAPERRGGAHDPLAADRILDL